MSMNHDSENFEQLRRLVAVKRHEQPPPGYFNSFSRQVCARIQAGERAGASSFFGRFFDFQSFWASFEAKPVLAAAVGIAVCGFLLTGIVYSTEHLETDGQAFIAPPVVDANLGLAGGHVSHSTVFEAPALSSFQLNNNLATVASPSSLLPVQPINFILPGN